ncbi:hypothetical protein M0R45_019896 [Rubus argutus]|uniref:Uncharacterized protein n=1 Tax=Rubus argutus TaxID=59490 RepID=A0AAW1X6R7_RUBAR
MALPRISKTHQNHWKSIKPINTNAFFSLIFTKNHTPSSNLPRPICTKSLDDPSLPSEVTHISDGLISIFTKEPFSQDKPRVEDLCF